MFSITATDLPRFMACNGSAELTSANLDIDADTTSRDEGRAAHWVVEQVYGGHFTADELVDRRSDDGVYITPEMVEHIEPYIGDVLDSEGCETFVECDTSMNGKNWQVRARADLVKYYKSTSTLHIKDLKYGWSVVEPGENWTLIAYALGFFAKNLTNKPFSKVTFTIYQPRAHHVEGTIRSVTYTGEKLAELSDQLATSLANPDGVLRTGNHCKNCPKLIHCPAARAASMNAIEHIENAYDNAIDNFNLSFELDNLQRAEKAIKDLKTAYQELAQHRLKKGEMIENYSLETALSNKNWHKHVTPEFVKMMTGRDLSKTTLITPTQAIAQGVEQGIIDTLSKRVNKGVALVRVSANVKALKLFNNSKKG